MFVTKLEVIIAAGLSTLCFTAVIIMIVTRLFVLPFSCVPCWAGSFIELSLSPHSKCHSYYLFRSEVVFVSRPTLVELRIICLN